MKKEKNAKGRIRTRKKKGKKEKTASRPFHLLFSLSNVFIRREDSLFPFFVCAHFLQKKGAFFYSSQVLSFSGSCYILQLILYLFVCTQYVFLHFFGECIRERKKTRKRAIRIKYSIKEKENAVLLIPYFF